MDKFGESARRGFDFLKSRAKETIEVQKLSSGVRDLESRRDKCLLDLGHRVWAMYDSPDFDKEALRDRVEEVRKLNKEIEAMKGDYDSVKTHLKSSVEGLLPGHSQPTSDAQPEPSQPPSNLPPGAPLPPEYDS